MIRNFKFQISNFKSDLIGLKCQIKNVFRIGNWKFDIGIIRNSPQGEAGFTLIEMLAVVTVLSVVGSIVLGIFFTSLRSSKKASSISTVRQDGNYVISQMARTIRYGKLNTLGGQTCPGASAQSFSVIGSDNNTYTYACVPPNITLNGVPMINTTDVEVKTTAPAICQFSCTQANSSVSPVVRIEFTLQSKNQTVVESIASVPFSTIVTMRNIY